MSEGAVSDLLERLARMETKLDVFLSRSDDHETRLRRVERVVWIATGFAATAGSAVGALLSKVITF